MTSMETRDMIIRARSEGMRVADIVRLYCVGRSTVYELFKLLAETGSIEPRPNPCGRKPALNQTQMHRLKDLLDESSCTTLEKIKAEMELPISLSALSRIIRNELGYRHRKRQYRPMHTHGSKGRQTDSGKR